MATQAQLPQLCRLSAHALLDLLEKGEVSAREVVEAHITRIQAIDPELNAVVLPRFEQALQEADEADRKRKAGGATGPLLGLPITVKEQFQVAGMPTTIGIERLKGKVYEQDGPLIGRLRKAGAIVLGKTNVMQTLLGYESHNPVYGRTHNPYDKERTPGGSSGGEAAIIAAMGSPLGIGGDLGGSIRIPSAFSGIHGFKATVRRFSIADTPARDVFKPGQNAILPVIGPMARTVEDLERILELWSQPSNEITGDLHHPIPWKPSSDVDTSQLRVGYLTEDEFFPVSPAIKRLIAEAADALAQEGMEVKPVSFPDLKKGIQLFTGAGFMDQGRWFTDSLGSEQPVPSLAGLYRGLKAPAWLRKVLIRLARLQGQHTFAWVANNLRTGSAQDYFYALAEIWAYRHQFLASLARQQADILLMPVCATPAFRHDSSGELNVAASYSMAINTVGAPAGTISLGRVLPEEETGRPAHKDRILDLARKTDEGSAGLPVGIQVVGRHWRDAEVLAVMRVLETQFQGREDYPIGTLA